MTGQATFAWDQKTVLIAAIGTIWIAAALFLMPPAGYIIDDFIYHAMIDAFANSGSLFVENGFAENRTDALRLELLRESNGRLAAQYPGGWGIIAAPAYLVAGLNGVMAINAIACALTLWLVWQIAWSMFNDRQLATNATLLFGLATFAVDYALAIWPHGLGMFCVAAAVVCVTKDMRLTSKLDHRWVLLSGLFLGLGVNIRVDAIFAAAPICIWLLGFSSRPYRSAVTLLVGLIPGVAIATIINWLKFGITTPITYGGAGGGVSFDFYAALIPAVVIGSAATLALGSPRVRSIVYQPKGMAAILIAGLCVTLLIPAFRDLGLRLLNGTWILLFDFQAIPVPAHGLTEMEDGTIRMWGLVKKALFQSLPYLAILIVLAPRLVYGPDRPAIGLCLLVFSLTALPFLYGTWHGGPSNNMRYFINSLPVLVILAALALQQLKNMMNGGTSIALISIICVVGYGALWPIFNGYEPAFVFQSSLPNALVVAIAAICTLTLFTRGKLQGIAARTVHSLAIVAILTAGLSAWFFDLSINLGQKSINYRLSELTADLPPDALIITNVPVRMALRVNRPPALTARISPQSELVDPSLANLLTASLTSGKPVFVQGRHLADRIEAKGLAVPGPARYGIPESVDMFELKPSPTSQIPVQ